MQKQISGIALAVAAATGAVAMPAQAERFELTFTGTLTRMQSSVDCASYLMDCASTQALSPVAPISFTRSIVFDVSSGTTGVPSTISIPNSTDWYGRPNDYELGTQSMGDGSIDTPLAGAQLPAALVNQLQAGPAPTTLGGSYASSFHSREIMRYLDTPGEVARSDSWGVIQGLGWTAADGRSVSLNFEILQAAPFPVTFENIAEPMSGSDFIARMNQDFFCAGCTQMLFAWSSVSNGSLRSDYLYHGSIGAFSLRQIGASAVPEPATYALMLAGVGAIGFMVRRRKDAEQALKP